MQTVVTAMSLFFLGNIFESFQRKKKLPQEIYCTEREDTIFIPKSQTTSHVEELVAPRTWETTPISNDPRTSDIQSIDILPLN